MSTRFVLPLCAAVAFAAATPSAGHDTLAALNRDFERRQRQLLDELARAQVDALAAYIAGHPDAADLQDARLEIVLAAAAVEDWPIVLEHSGSLLDLDDRDPRRRAAVFHRARALADAGRADDARTLLISLAEQAGGDANLVVEAWIAVADLYLDDGDVDGARLAYDRMREMGRDNEAVVDMAARKKRALDLIGSEAQPLEGTSLAGGNVSLADFAGRVVLIDFWATWCEPYTQELYHLLDAYDAFHERGFEVLGVCLDRELDRARLVRFVANRGMVWPQLHDGKGWDGAAARAYGVDALPSSVLVDREGRIHRVDLRGRELHRALASMFP